MVSFNSFRELDPETADLARELINVEAENRSPFASFMNLWMGFNGWMECVTDAPNDAAMIGALVGHGRLVTAYDTLLSTSSDFGEAVRGFATMWPVVSVKDVRRKLGRDAFRRYASREELMAAVVAHGAKHVPAGYDGETPTWEQLLRTIYQVRCNLFHGSKSSQNVRDHELVVASDLILRMFIEGTDCFDWRD